MVCKCGNLKESGYIECETCRNKGKDMKEIAIKFILDDEGNKLIGYNIIDGILHYHIYSDKSLMYTETEDTLILHTDMKPTEKE